VRVLNFDDSVTRQRRLVERYNPIVIDLTPVGPACRVSMNAAVAKRVRRALSPDLRGAITFLGSGDFHHVSSLLIEQFDEPLSVIVFDHHPDWDTLPPKLHCGSWVTNMLRRPNIQKLLLLGVSSEDISCPWIQTGNLRALRGDRVEIYPYAHAPTKTILKRVPDNRSIQVQRGLFTQTIYWQELAGKEFDVFFNSVLDRLQPKQVYVSIDKDCLIARHSLTNWEEGCLKLEDLLRPLELIQQRAQIVGLDIVGDYSPPIVKGWMKALWAEIDRPKAYSAKGQSDAVIHAVNEDTNMRLLDVLTRSLIASPIS